MNITIQLRLLSTLSDHCSTTHWSTYTAGFSRWWSPFTISNFFFWIMSTTISYPCTTTLISSSVWWSCHFIYSKIHCQRRLVTIEYLEVCDAKVSAGVCIRYDVDISSTPGISTDNTWQHTLHNENFDFLEVCDKTLQFERLCKKKCSLQSSLQELIK